MSLIQSEQLDNSVKYSLNVINFLVDDRKRLVDIILLLMIEAGKYEVSIPIPELMEIKEGTSLYYNLSDTPNVEDVVLTFGICSTDEQRDEITKRFTDTDA